MKQQPAIEPVKSTRKSPFRVAVVEDEQLFRESWARRINSFPDFKCLCECASGEEALAMVPGKQPDVILMDVLLPGISGIECTFRLKKLLPESLIVILTALDDDELIFRALEAGADGYLLKRTKPVDVRAALLDVLSGGAPMTSAIARRVVKFFRKEPVAKQESIRLSAREEEMLELLSKGYSNKEIAEQSHLTLETVRTYLKRIYEKMHVRSRTEAAVRYVHFKSP
ncbi:MAG TPA: response regulator transcription factor [Verrucomicrobiae bacterium]|jgi:DNA-binding NarL/FixJ family response regulator|nr:response regulator transcription factor [Verrucomicrobiae bacterium]